MGDAEFTARRTHALHRAVGMLMDKVCAPGIEILKDSACESLDTKSVQRLPLFCAKEKRRSNQFCNVDMLVIQDSRVKVILEIEESGIKPSKICGKLLTSSLSRYFIHERYQNRPIPLANRVLFVQVVRNPRKSESKSMKAQWMNLAASLKQLAPIGTVTDYEFFHGSVPDFKGVKGEELVGLVSSYLESQPPLEVSN
jgi:hypothetical protein